MRIENQMHHPDHETLVEILIDLQDLSRDRPIIVEGIKDIDSLKGLGLHAEVLHLNQGNPLIDFCTKIADEHSSVIILTDWDSKGNSLCRILKQNFKACDVQFDTRLRGRLAATLKKDVKDVQGILPFLERNHPETLLFIKKELDRTAYEEVVDGQSLEE